MDNLIPIGRKWSFTPVEFITTPADFEYVQPSYAFVDESRIRQSRYLVIAAPGAVGKSAFGLHLAQTKNAMLWDLAKLRLGSNTFIGSVLQTIGTVNLADFLASIESGETTLVFDAFDEAELHSGWTGVQEFLKEIVNYTKNAKPASIVFLARRETAELLELILSDLLPSSVGLAKASIGFFSREGAADFVLSQISRLKGNNYLSRNEIVLKQKTQEAFAMPVVGDDGASASDGWRSPEHERFFGYAPVLQTIARLLAESDNLYTVSFDRSRTGYAEVVGEILDVIQRREEDKFIAAVNQRFASEKDFSLNGIYSPEDQQRRLFGFLNNDQSDAYALSQMFVPHIASELTEMIRSFLPQHPFLDGNVLAGPAFRDYLLARGLTSGRMRFAAQLWIDTFHPLYTPILASLYHNISDGLANAEDVELLYESANAGGTNTQSSLLLFISDDNPQTLSIEIASDETNPLVENLHFRAVNPESLLFSRRLNNAQVITTSTVVFGLKDQTFEFIDCDISAPLIHFETDRVHVRSENAGSTRIESAAPIQAPPTLKIDVQSKALFSVVAPNSKAYPWNHFSSESSANHATVDVEGTLHVIARILGWFRKDRRKEFGRYKDLIVKHVVGSSPTARYALGFIQHVGALYDVGNLYFIDTDILDFHEISWQTIRGGSVSSKAKLSVENYLLTTPQPPQF
ncbi:hypothetical protein BXU06_15110 [Aquaspirillum sp. LM1]|uniref:hypothetical protein n=1 Tax=Aquaspirillum sp. LM1 TaxID=1938604 RepID=UPI000983D2C3|nr:hypothetical protein [Aquaspirillum sp. LM1]AQR66225.1 hypothetical protein BXU06_15110 [Aquaspirillum sp. LM1]